MATLEGKKYECRLGNLRKATEQERKIIQQIMDLKEKQKMISDEISNRCGMLGRDVAVACEINTEDEKRWVTCIPSKPKWVHIPVPEWGLTRYPTTKADRRDLDINS